MKIDEKKLRVIARGEHSNHSHVVVGEAALSIDKNGILIADVPTGASAEFGHILEREWLGGKEVWTKEHHPIPFDGGAQYRFVQQQEYHPYLDKIVQTRD